ncbi:MAG TPA: MFS transporter [Candidatus Binataceae bacterium]|nr:MFS transporter [Candidatus Binataceae bacterium]
MAGWFSARASADAKLLLATRALRGFADGAVSVILPSYLTAIGLGSFQVGAIVFGTLLGSAVLTLWVGLAGSRIAPRRILISASVLMFATGIGFFSAAGFWTLFAVAVIGTMNPSAGDVSLFLPAEQTALAESVADRDLTSMFGFYNVAGAIAGALGALASGIPAIVAARAGSRPVAAERMVFLGYSIIAIIAGVVYAKLRQPTHQAPPTGAGASLGKSRRMVLKLSALFSLDAFGGGFVVQSLLALWLFRRFNLDLEVAGTFFFAAGLLGALSQLLSTVVAARIGRVRTMAYTHIPANALLIAAALMPNARRAIALLLARSALSSMDVPARQSYVMAIVEPEERAAAASVTNVPRSLASAFAPLPAGALLDASNFGWPLICAGGLKILYDLILLAQFRSAHPADEEVN